MAKKITFPPRSATERKQRILAVAHITQEVGGWEGSNVARLIQDRLEEDGYTVTAHTDNSTNVLNRVSDAMVWLTEQGFAARVVKGKRTTEFVMDPEVVVPTPDYVKGKTFRTAKEEADPGTAKVLAAPPLPGRRLDLAPLINAVQAWHAKDREAAENWVRRVVLDLEA